MHTNATFASVKQCRHAALQNSIMFALRTQAALRWPMAAARGDVGMRS